MWSNLFVLEINFFVKWIQKRKKECKKMQKRASKLADLVCTKEFFLYKSSQISNKCKSDFLVCYLFLLATVWTHDKRGQIPPNDTKRKRLLLMHDERHVKLFVSNEQQTAFLLVNSYCLFRVPLSLSHSAITYNTALTIIYSTHYFCPPAHSILLLSNHYTIVRE